MEVFDAIVIGAGPSGSVASAYLHNQGKSVLVLEKDIFPRFVIGESLLPNCMNHLEEVGLLDAVKDVGFQIKSGASFYVGEKKFSFEFSEQFTKGWEWTWQVKRAEFDKLLIDEVVRKGVDVRFNCEVIDVNFGKEQQLLKYKDEKGNSKSVSAKFVIDASGYGRVLPRLLNLNTPSELRPRGAVFTHLLDSNRTKKAESNIFVHSFNDNTSWLWAIPFSDGSASVGVVGDNAFVEDLAMNNAEKFKALIQSMAELKGRFTGVELQFEPKTLLGYSIGVKQMQGEGYVLCGNSTEFLDPIFSSGVTLATASGLLAAQLCEKQLNGEEVNWLADYEDVLNEGIDVFRTYVDSWYNGDLHTIFFADEIKDEFKRQICSVLAGYVWDQENPFIKKHKTLIKTLSKVIRLDAKNKAN
jgi:flavin-dependent dehydrogenase